MLCSRQKSNLPEQILKWRLTRPTVICVKSLAYSLDILRLLQDFV